MNRVGALVLYVIIMSLGFLAPARPSFAAEQCNDLPMSCALQIAYDEFSEHLRRNANGKGDPQLLEFLGRIENYTVEIRQDEKSFLVRFHPNDFQGSRLRGGGGEYVIAKSSMQIEAGTLFK